MASHGSTDYKNRAGTAGTLCPTLCLDPRLVLECFRGTTLRKGGVMGKVGMIGNLDLNKNDPTVKFHEDVMGPTNHPFSKLKLLASHCSSARWLPDWLQSVDVQWRWERSGCILKHHELSEDVPKGKERYHWHAYCFRKQTYIISILVENCLNLCGVDSDIINCNQGLFTDLF